jgi:hypothetical protein
MRRGLLAVALVVLAGCGEEQAKPITQPLEQTNRNLKVKQQTETELRNLGKSRASEVDKILDQRNKAVPKP